VTTILHVEDDPVLADLVRISFDSFGFRGRSLNAATVAEAARLLSDGGAPKIDLIIVDMNLPDGSGLDVVRIAKTNPRYAQVPVLVLSSDTSPDKVNRAYALGANCYLAKMPPGRSIVDVIKALYEHWLQDARLPRHPSISRTRQAITRAVQFRARLADIFVRIARHQVPDATFWMTTALREGNLANLLAFVGLQFEGELPEKTLGMIEAYQDNADRTFIAMENALQERPINTPEDAYRILIDYLFSFRIEPFAEASASLFPAAPAAMESLIELAAANLDGIASWLETRVGDSTIRKQIAVIRANASSLRSLRPISATPPN
jgi:DNA-binding response OmpR family regulator